MTDTPQVVPIPIGSLWNDKDGNAYEVVDFFYWNNIKIVTFKAIGSLAKQLEEVGIKNIFVRTAQNFLYDYKKVK